MKRFNPKLSVASKSQKALAAHRCHYRTLFKYPSGATLISSL